ncbi:MAG: Hint domain-containing protein [Methylocystis sp.]
MATDDKIATGGEASYDNDSRRRFLSRNLLAAGVVLAGSMASKSASATSWSAGCCFLRGTKIRTLDGDRNIEDLVPGDVLPTLFGGTRRIQWVARHSYRKSDAEKPWVEDVRPIRILRSAIAPGVPSRDVYLSKEHRLYVDGVLVRACNLVNGTTILVDTAEQWDELEYFNLKLECHDVVYAEDLTCESLLEVCETAANFADYYRTYGEPKGEETPCAPVARYGGRRDLILSRLRSAASPWLDRRTKIDVVRDRLEERALTLV